MVVTLGILTLCALSFVAGVLATVVLGKPWRPLWRQPTFAPVETVTSAAHCRPPHVGTVRLLELGALAPDEAIDALTAIVDTDALVEVLRHDALSANQQPLTLMLVRIESLNDLLHDHGPRVAEAMLRALVQMIRATTRAQLDKVLRHGTDSIAVILTRTEMLAAERSAARLKRALGGFRFRHEGRDLSVSAAIGLTQLVEANVTAAVREVEQAVAGQATHHRQPALV